MDERIIVLLDMDCFYVQVEERDNPKIKGHPAAVVQYNTWKGGGIIAVNYEARDFGVKRGMRGEEAKEKCPSIYLVQVPVLREKADLTKYRNAGKEVVSVLCEFSDCVERASIDEAYIDFTKIVEQKLQAMENKLIDLKDLHGTWVVGYDKGDDDELTPQSIRQNGLSTWLNDIGLSKLSQNPDLEEEEESESYASEREEAKLALAAVICEEMRKKVCKTTGFKCSAGISVNKMLAKLACGLHKPNQQTILPMKSVSVLWSNLSVGKVRNLGGKLGDSLTEDLGCKTMADLSRLTIKQLSRKYDDKTARWLHLVGQGVDNEPVIARQLPKSVGCSKNFNGKEILNTMTKVKSWVMKLSEELHERLDEDQSSNSRIAKTLTVCLRFDDSGLTRSCSFPSNEVDKIAKTVISLVSNLNTASDKSDNWNPPIRNISLSAGKFEDLNSGNITKIDSIFKKIDGTMKSQARHSHSSTRRPRIESNFKSSSSSAKLREKRTKNHDRLCSLRKSFFLQVHSSKRTEDSDGDLVYEDETKGQRNKKMGNDKPLNIQLETDSVYDTSTDSDEKEEEEGYKNTPALLNIKANCNSDASDNGVLSFDTNYYQEKGACNSESNDIDKLRHKSKVNSDIVRSRKRFLNSPILRKSQVTTETKTKEPPKSFFLQFLANKESMNAISDSNTDEIKRPKRTLDGESERMLQKATEYSGNNLKDHSDIKTDCGEEVSNVLSHSSHSVEEFGNPSTSRCLEFSNQSEKQSNLSCIHSTSYTPDLQDNSSTVMVHELFPDLDNVDQSVLEILPDNIRKQVHLEIENLRQINVSESPDSSLDIEKISNASNPLIYKDADLSNKTESNSTTGTLLANEIEYGFCKECNRRISKANITEHKDYHFAMELRKQQLSDRRSEIVSNSKKNSGIKNSKSSTGNKMDLLNRRSSNSPKIHLFFNKN